MSILSEIRITEGNVIAFPGRRPTQSVKEVLIFALNAQSVGLHYQPQYSLTTGEMVGAEALLRIQGADGAMLNPLTVVETAERGQLIDWLGHSVMRTACREYAALRAERSTLGRLAINVSPHELRQTNYAEDVAREIVDAGLEYSDVELEITESASLSDPTLILDHLYSLADSGVSIAIDDFGTGHTAWTHVLALPISTLKIDRSLAAQVTDSKSAEIVVRNLCNTCDELGIQVIGEGVNSIEQQSRLVELGCTVGQGFGLARPMAAKDLLAVSSSISGIALASA